MLQPLFNLLVPTPMHVRPRLASWPVRVIKAPLRLCHLLRWWQLALLFLIASSGIGVSIYLVWKSERETRHQEMVAEAQQRLDLALERQQYDAVEPLMAQVAKLTGDSKIAERLESLRRGEAGPRDLPLARMLMWRHLGEGRWPEATREAKKVITHSKDDLTARVILARDELQAGRHAEARAQVHAIPRLSQLDGEISPAIVLLLAQLRRELDEDASSLESFCASHVAPLLRTRQPERLSGPQRLVLIQAYHEAVRAPERLAELADLWVPAARLLAREVENPELAVQTALASERHLLLLQRLQRGGYIPAPDVKALATEMERQIRTAWEKAHTRSQRDPLPYVGLALTAHRAGNSDEAQKWLDRGIEACDDDRVLYLTLAQVVRDQHPLLAGVHLEKAFTKYPDDEEVQRALAETAAAVNRPDRARDVCRHARKQRPGLGWACRLEATCCLALGRPTQALEALESMSEQLPQDSQAMTLYTRAACAVGVEAQVDLRLAGQPMTGPNLAGHVGAARGFLTAGRTDEALLRADQVLDVAPNDDDVRRVRAEALRLIAEANDAPEWRAEAVRRAIDAYDWLRRRYPNDRWVAQRIARLELKGLHSPGQALHSVSTLRSALPTALTPEQAVILGATLVANGLAVDAITYLDAAITAAPNMAGAYIERAVAFSKLGKKIECQSDLRRAMELPLSQREQAELNQLIEQLRNPP